MFSLAITFLIVALLAAIFGFTGLAGVAVDFAQIVFIIALVLFAFSAIVGMLRSRSA